MASSDNGSDKAFAELFELFSKPSKAPQKAYRTFTLKFENGEPVWTLSEIDRMLDEVIEEIFGPPPVPGVHYQAPLDEFLDRFLD